jgi:hypothetical protein
MNAGGMGREYQRFFLSVGGFKVLMAIEMRLLHQEKVPSPIPARPSGKVMALRLLHLEKAQSPIIATPFQYAVIWYAFSRRIANQDGKSLVKQYPVKIRINRVRFIHLYCSKIVTP